MSSHLSWMIIRNTNAYLVKKRNISKPFSTQKPGSCYVSRTIKSGPRVALFRLRRLIRCNNYRKDLTKVFPIRTSQAKKFEIRIRIEGEMAIFVNNHKNVLALSERNFNISNVFNAFNFLNFLLMKNTFSDFLQTLMDETSKFFHHDG
ncbi:unnamed protein product, partial [Nesidiocoris tenuis]